jgi:hypothetical protein
MAMRTINVWLTSAGGEGRKLPVKLPWCGKIYPLPQVFFPEPSDYPAGDSGLAIMRMGIQNATV